MNISNYRINPNVLSEYIDNDLVLVNTNTNQILELNETAGLLWKLILQNKSIATIRELFLSEYETSEEILDIEISKTLGELLNEQMLIAVDAVNSKP